MQIAQPIAASAAGNNGSQQQQDHHNHNNLAAAAATTTGGDRGNRNNFQTPNGRSIHRGSSMTTIRRTNQQQQAMISSRNRRFERGDSKTKSSKPNKSMKVKMTLPPLPASNVMTYNAEVDGDVTGDSRDDSGVNRMNESCALFQTIVHSCWFRATSVILFLNKTDILKEKIEYSHLAAYDPTYEGERGDADAASNHILNRYVTCFNKHKNNKRTLYTHFTCATNTSNIRFVFAAIKDIILHNYLENYNLI